MGITRWAFPEIPCIARLHLTSGDGFNCQKGAEGAEGFVRLIAAEAQHLFANARHCPHFTCQKRTFCESFSTTTQGEMR